MIAPGTKRESSLDSNEDGGREDFGFNSVRSIRRVGDNESINSTPHEGHDLSSSAIGFEHEGQRNIGREFYPKSEVA